MTEAVIVGFRREGVAAPVALRQEGLRHQPGHVLLGALDQFKLTARSAGQVQGPVAPGFDERMR